MYPLILKDFLMLKRMFLLLLAFIGLFFILQNPPTFVIAMSGFIFISNTGSFEDRSNSHIMLNSLPISRKSIISSKYIGSLLFGIFAISLGTMFQAVFHFVLHMYNEPLPEIRHLLIGMLCILLFASFYYPILYKFGEKYTRIVTLLFIAGILVFGKILMYLLKDKLGSIQLFFSQFTHNQLLIAGSAVTALLYLFSWFITIKIYEVKDF